VLVEPGLGRRGSSSGAKYPVPLVEVLGVGAQILSAWNDDAATVDTLKSMDQCRSVDLVQDVLPNFDSQVRKSPECFH
jgi:hypothetical protein